MNIIIVLVCNALGDVMLNRYHRVHIDVMHACNNLCVKEMHIWDLSVVFSLISAHFFEKHFIFFGCLQRALQDSHR